MAEVDSLLVYYEGKQIALVIVVRLSAEQALLYSESIGSRSMADSEPVEKILNIDDLHVFVVVWLSECLIPLMKNYPIEEQCFADSTHTFYAIHNYKYGRSSDRLLLSIRF